MRVAVLAFCVALAACQKAPASIDSASAKSPNAQIEEHPASVEGWDNDAYPLLGSVIPDFRAKRTGGGADATQEDLRGHWTILGVLERPQNDEESKYVSALASAAGQDPDLDVMWVYTALDMRAAAKPGTGRSAVQIDGKDLAARLQIDHPPAYLLIGPDLAIEAHRGALSATPRDGIKPVIRGIAEIRKQIAAPG